MNPFPLALALARLSLAPQDHLADATTDLRELAQIEVSADPLGRSEQELLQPVEILSGAKLDKRRSNTLGDTLSGETGVHSSFFGAGVGRPIIRGLDGARVEVLSDGISSQDASTVSVDHAVAIDPFVAERIEVLKGPATLLYGSAAIGGAVNVVDGRVPDSAPINGFTGRAQIFGDSVADTLGAAARIDAGNQQWVVHADAFSRDSADYSIPAFASSDPSLDQSPGSVANSALQTQGGAFGLSALGDSARIGLAYSTFDTNYGIPADDQEEVRIDLQQSRWDLAGRVSTEASAARHLKLRLGHSDYQHQELEDGLVGTQFDNQQTDWRIEIEHAPVGAWRGVYGISGGHRAFDAIGEEAFVPPSHSDNTAAFLIESGSFGRWIVEGGVRAEKNEIEARDQSKQRHDLFSWSLGARMALNEQWSWTSTAQQAQRAPGAEELFSDGPHVATASYEQGDATLGKESARQLELGLQYASTSLRGKFNVFANDFDDYLYLTDLDAIEDGLPVRQWTQADARFRGIEASLTWALPGKAYGDFALTLHGDLVRAELRNGGDLPRTPPARLGLGLQWNRDRWSSSIDLLHVSDQDRLATGESETRGYLMIDADLVYAFTLAGQELEAYAQGRNLGDREARVHTSLLKDRAPLPGRNFVVGLRAFF